MKEGKRKKAERIRKILEVLDNEYSTELYCPLNHGSAWELLVATILSAQCTDARVNIITEKLFKKYPSIESYAGADLKELEDDIRSAGFYHNKAKNIILCARQITGLYQGEVPSGLSELTGLAGVGRKTANVIRGNIYNIPSIVVDTHVKRISRLLEITDTLDPEKAELELMEALPRDHWILWNVHIITLGRSICIANRPQCGKCPLSTLCPSALPEGPHRQ